jgi:hypothetical protein
MGGSIDDASAELDLFYYQWLLQVLNLFSIIGTLLVKITDDNAKEHKFKKALNIEIVSIDLQQSLVSTIHASSNYEDGILVKEVRYFSMSILCNLNWAIRWSYFISNRILYRIGN